MGGYQVANMVHVIILMQLVEVEEVCLKMAGGLKMFGKHKVRITGH